MSLKWKVGDAVITRIVETETRLRGEFLFPGADMAELASMPWLKPHFVTDKGHLLFSIHSLVVDFEGQRILVDTCYGNDKDRAGGFGHMLETPYLDRLNEAGITPESVDVVLCTHLHVDHVGWNTRIVDGRWAPTFPNARYLFYRKEFEHWSTNTDPAHHSVACYNDSVAPLVDAGLVELVESDHQVNAAVSLVPSPGHTPGHVCVRILSQGEEALISGDAFHHPCQLGRPDWVNSGDSDQKVAVETRKAIFSNLADGGGLLIGTHFAPPTVGRVVRDGDAYRFVAS